MICSVDLWNASIILIQQYRFNKEQGALFRQINNAAKMRLVNVLKLSFPEIDYVSGAVALLPPCSVFTVARGDT